MDLLLGPPKSPAARRVVALPQAVVPALRRHLGEYVGQEPDSFVFTGLTGATIWRGNFNKLVGWKAATTKIGYPNLHFHDLRHTGNTLASRTGDGSLRRRTRMGHDSPRAALIYQHASREADRAIAKAVDVAVRRAQKRAPRNGRRANRQGLARRHARRSRRMARQWHVRAKRSLRPSTPRLILGVACGDLWEAGDGN